MDAFEKARQKYEKNKRNNDKYRVPVSLMESPPILEPEVKLEKVEQIPALLVPKEKTKSDAVITVTVELPNGSFSFSLKKRSILSNVPAAKLNANEFRNAIMRGLEPLCGRVE